MARPVSEARAARPASRRLYQWGAAKRAGQASTEPAPPGTGWTILSYLLSGIVAYGAIGWLVGRAVHLTLLFPAGMLIGLGISTGFVIYRYGRP
jgi:ATP synthase protein I